MESNGNPLSSLQTSMAGTPFVLQSDNGDSNTYGTDLNLENPKEFQNNLLDNNHNRQLDNDAVWSKLNELNQKRLNISNKIRQECSAIKPLEFESYHEFFTINTFKKGISASGRVDIDYLRRNHNKMHRKIKRGIETSTREPIESSESSSLSSGELEEDEQSIYRNRLRKHRAHSAQESIDRNSARENEFLIPQSDEINGNISTSSILPKTELDSNIRRSTRLSSSNTATETLSTKSTKEADGHVPEIKELYESIIPKIKEPHRRSDWILPPRLRYTPEKKMRTKVIYEKVNLNELVSIGKIQKVLSRFEGGITGVRKKAWNI